MPSTFEETLPFGGFQDPHEYPVATATHKAVEVYERLVVSPRRGSPSYAFSRCLRLHVCARKRAECLVSVLRKRRNRAAMWLVRGDVVRPTIVAS